MQRTQDGLADRPRADWSALMLTQAAIAPLVHIRDLYGLLPPNQAPIILTLDPPLAIIDGQFVALIVCEDEDGH